jgi:hypothetical protein
VKLQVQKSRAAQQQAAAVATALTTTLVGCVSHGIAGTRGMPNISGEFGNVCQLALLSNRPRQRHSPKSGNQRLVVSHHVELPSLQHKMKMPKGRKHCSELPIKRGVMTLRRRQLL